MIIEAKAYFQQMPEQKHSADELARTTPVISSIDEARKRKKFEEARQRVYRAAKNLDW